MKLRTQPSYWFYSLINIYLWFMTPYINSSMIIILILCMYILVSNILKCSFLSVVVCMTKIFKPNWLERLIWDSESWGQWHNFWRFFIQILCLARLCFIKKCLFFLKLDGYVARNFKGQMSSFGTFLDPLADKVMMTVMFTTLSMANIVPGKLS